VRSREPELRFTFDSRTHSIERERGRFKKILFILESLIIQYTLSVSVEIESVTI